MPYWHDVIVPEMLQGENLVIVAHNNTIRALVQLFKLLKHDQVSKLSIPNSIPYVFEFDSNMNYYND